MHSPHSQPPPNDLDTHKFNVTFMANASATALKPKVMTLPELRDRILKTSGPTKLQLPWLKMAAFGDVRSKKNSLRTDANVLSIEGIELDYDGLKMSFEEAVKIVRRMNVRALIYTSPSYNAATLKWRLILPLSEPRAKEMRVKYVARVNGFFKDAAKVDGNFFASESFTLSQGFFYGRAEDNLTANHQAIIIDGQFIDLQDDLCKYEASGAKQKPPKGGSSGFEAYLAAIGDGPGHSGFRENIRSAIASYAATHGKDLDREALKVILRDTISKAPKDPKRDPATIERYLSDEDLDGLIESAIEKFGDDVDSDGALILDPSNPIKSARIIIGRAFTDVHGLKTLHRHRGEFWQWSGTNYRQSEDEMLGGEGRAADLCSCAVQAETLECRRNSRGACCGMPTRQVHQSACMAQQERLAACRRVVRLCEWIVTPADWRSSPAQP
jgi:hypothetical protein